MLNFFKDNSKIEIVGEKIYSTLNGQFKDKFINKNGAFNTAKETLASLSKKFVADFTPESLAAYSFIITASSALVDYDNSDKAAELLGHAFFLLKNIKNNNNSLSSSERDFIKNNWYMLYTIVNILKNEELSDTANTFITFFSGEIESLTFSGENSSNIQKILPEQLEELSIEKIVGSTKDLTFHLMSLIKKENGREYMVVFEKKAEKGNLFYQEFVCQLIAATSIYLLDREENKEKERFFLNKGLKFGRLAAENGFGVEQLNLSILLERLSKFILKENMDNNNYKWTDETIGLFNESYKWAIIASKNINSNQTQRMEAEKQAKDLIKIYGDIIEKNIEDLESSFSDDVPF